MFGRWRCNVTSWCSFAAGMVALLMVAGPATAEVPSRLTHQGRLLDDEGEPVTESRQATFTLYDSKTGGAVLWEGQKTVTPDDGGFYSVVLGGPQNPIEPSAVRGGEVWLGVSLDGDELKPRLSLDAAPYALRAGTAESLADGAEVDADQLPSEFSDGDDDTLGGISCQQGQVAQYDGSNWTCTAPSVDWDNVANTPTGLDDGDDDTLGGLSCQNGYVPKATSSGWACREDEDTTVRDWNQLQNVPADIADGDDDTLGGVSCQTGQVPVYDGSQWACTDQTTDSDTLASLNCSQGERAEWNGTNWTCASDETGVDGSGQSGRLAKFSGSTKVGDSIVAEKSGRIDVDGGVQVGSTQNCTKARAGTLRYNKTTNSLEICAEQKWWRVGGKPQIPKDCEEILNRDPGATSGRYRIDPDGRGGDKPFTVYCDMQTDGGGWIRVLNYDAGKQGNSFSNHASQWTSVDNKMRTSNCGGPGDAVSYAGYDNCSDKGSSCETLYYRADLSKFDSSREVRFEHRDRVESWDAALMTEVEYRGGNVQRQVYDNHGCTLPVGACPGSNDISRTYDRSDTYSGAGTELKEFRWGVKWWQSNCGDRHQIYDYALYIR